MKKYKAEQYYLPTEKDTPYAFITLCEETGTVDIQSDHGNWQHQWLKSSHGRKSLKHFLCESRYDFSYFQDKFGYPSCGRPGAGEWFDFDSTIKAIEKQINDEEIDDNKKREFLSDLEEMQDCKTANEFYHALPESILNDFYEGDFGAIPSIRGTHPQLVQFMKRIWPRFISELTKEIV